MLALESDTYPSESEFLDACAARMDAGDYGRLIYTQLYVEPGYRPRTAAQKQWYELELALRNALARVRAAALNRDAEESVRRTTDGRDPGEDPAVVGVVREAYSQESPLRQEERLLQYRWELLEQMAVGHFFDLDALVIYYLKLKILERRAVFDREAGENAFDTTYRGVQENYFGASA
jgi:hypothetical protein